MTTYAFPSTIIPDRTRFIYRSGVALFQARNAAVQKAQQMPDHWRVTLEVNQRMSAERAAIQAFLLKLSTGDHNFTLKDHSYLRRGTGAGTPLVNGANQTGNSIVTDGWTASAAGVLLEGDMIQVRNQLVMVTADVSANGSGQATISVTPAVRIAPADNSAIVTATPTGIFKLLTPEVDWQQGGGMVRSDFVFDCIEDVLA